jgi:hypothetical protein
MENQAVSANNPTLPEERMRPVRVRKFKDDYVTENACLRMKVDQLEKELRRFKEMPTMRRIAWALKAAIQQGGEK